MDRIFSENDIGAVMHFAAYSLVGESMEKPLKYFGNNVCKTEKLLESMIRAGGQEYNILLFRCGLRRNGR